MVALNVRPDSSPATRRRAVLIVDDDPLARDVGRHVLEYAGYEVITADDGETGVRTYGERGATIDLVILDYNMPGMTGVETLEQLMRLDPKVRVLAWSGEYEQAVADQFLAAGAREFVDKPCAASRLLENAQGIMDWPRKTGDRSTPTGE